MHINDESSVVLCVNIFLQHSVAKVREDRPVSFLSRLVGSDADHLNVIRSPYTNRLVLLFLVGSVA